MWDKRSKRERIAFTERTLTDPDRLPATFRQSASWEDGTLELAAEAQDTRLALAQRPELAELRIVRQQLCVALRQAKNR